MFNMNKKCYKFISDKDLSETQIYMTMQAYDRHAKEYADCWEWNPKTIKEIKKYNIKPFAKYAKKSGSVLLAGCRSGRDYSLLTKIGYSCLGIEWSYGLLTEAVKRVPGGLFVRFDLRILPFMPESFDAVYADALTYVPKKNIKEVLKDFRIFLKPKGILYLSLKLGEGNVFVMNDFKNKRYMTLFKKQEIINMLKEVNLKILWSEVSFHTDPSLPKWFSLIAEKK